MWIFISLAVTLVVGAGCFSFVMRVRKEGHSQYQMRLIKSLSFIITFASCLMLYFGMYLFLMSVPEGGVSWSQAFDILLETERVLDKFIAAIVGIGIAFFINIKKSSMGYATKHTIAQFMVGMVAIFVLVVVAVGYKAAVEHKKKG